VSDDIQITHIPAQLALVVTKHVPMTEIGAGMGEAFHALMRHAEATGAQFVGPPTTLYPEIPRDEVTFLVCMPVAPGAVGGEGVDLRELPAVEAATLLYTGPYEGMGPSWERLMAWLGTSGRRAGGPMREVYLNDPDSVAPEDLLTQLVVPLA
jgi:effector-binding domain-containing protein